MRDAFLNYAGRFDVDALLAQELAAAGIPYKCLPEAMRLRHREVKTVIIGVLHRWSFERAWRYWVAQGDGIPPTYAEPFHTRYGQEVRVDGHCSCPSPFEHCGGFAVGRYHIDTQRGLTAFAQLLNAVAADAELLHKQKEPNHAL